MRKFLIVILLILFVLNFAVSAYEFSSKTVIVDEVSDIIVHRSIGTEIFPAGLGAPPPGGGGP